MNFCTASAWGTSGMVSGGDRLCGDGLWWGQVLVGTGSTGMGSVGIGSGGDGVWWGQVGTGSVGTGSGDCLSERHSHRLLCTCKNSLLLQPHNRRAVLSPISQMRRARPSVVSASPAGHREAQLPGCRVAVRVPGMSQGGDSGGHSGWVTPDVTELAAD